MSLLSVSVFAGPKFEITPMVGKKMYNYSDDAPRLDDGEALIGASANAYVTDRVSLQVAAEASKENHMIKTGEPDAWTDLERGMVNVQYDVPTKGKLSKITPFVLGGLGYERLHKSEASTNVDSQMFYNAGAGLRYNINDRVDLVAESRVIHKVEDQDTDLIGSLGLGFKFGQKQKEKQKAMSLADLRAKTQKATPAVVATPVVAPVAPAPVVVEAAPEVVSTRIEYDSGVVDMCHDDVTSSCPSDRAQEAGAASGYYVQVIALRKNSTDVITSRLDAKGYNYTFQSNGDLTRVLAGPYESRAAAKRALSGLKKIRRDAFIYRVQ